MEQSGIYQFGGTLFDSDDNGSLPNHKIVKESSVEILSSQGYTHKVAEQYFAEQTKADETSSKQTGVILASITCNSNGQITEIDDSIRQYVYNNPLLSQLISCEENQFGKLPKHGLTHQYGGSDPINVENLNGVLAQPQKVDVYSENMKQHVAQKLRFTGEGVSVDEDPKDKGLVNISVPSKEIMVYTDGDNYLTANRLSFEGEGVKVDEGRLWG